MKQSRLGHIGHSVAGHSVARHLVARELGHCILGPTMSAGPPPSPNGYLEGTLGVPGYFEVDEGYFKLPESCLVDLKVTLKGVNQMLILPVTCIL